MKGCTQHVDHNVYIHKLGCKADSREYDLITGLPLPPGHRYKRSREDSNHPADEPRGETSPREEKTKVWLNKDTAALLSGLGQLPVIAQHIDKYFEGIAQAKKEAMIVTDDGAGDEALLGDWEDLEIEITLDSGCVDHVMDAAEAPGYCILESAGSKRKQNFVVGNGQRCPNKGEMHLNMEAFVGSMAYPIKSVFQIADITRPLMSVSKICDQGLQCIFMADKAVVKNAKNETVCEFQRRGGLYVATMRLKRPIEPGTNAAPFPRPER